MLFLIVMFLVADCVTVDYCHSVLLLLCTAGSVSDKLELVCNELDQLRDNGAESVEQSLVCHGEMTPFGTMANTSAEVNMYYCCCCCCFCY